MESNCSDAQKHWLPHFILHWVVPCPLWLQLCLCLDCCIQTTVESDSSEKILKLGQKWGILNWRISMMPFFFFFVKGKSKKSWWLLQHRLTSGYKSTLWNKSTACTAWFSRFLSCFLCKCIFGCKRSCSLFPGEHFWKGRIDSYHSFIFFLQRSKKWSILLGNIKHLNYQPSPNTSIPIILWKLGKFCDCILLNPS